MTSVLFEGTTVEMPDGQICKLGPVHDRHGIWAAVLIPIHQPPSKLKPTGDAHRDKIVAARLNLRRGEHA